MLTQPAASLIPPGPLESLYLHQYGVCSRLISACDDVVTETDHRLYGGAGSPGWGRRRKRGRSAENSFRCIGRRRFGSRRHRRSESGSSFGHCELAGCDVQVRLVSRSCRSFRPIRHADRQPRCRTCHVGPRLRLLYASVSALRPLLISSCFLEGVSDAPMVVKRTALRIDAGRRARDLGSGLRARGVSVVVPFSRPPQPAIEAEEALTRALGAGG